MADIASADSGAPPPSAEAPVASLDQIAVSTAPPPPPADGSAVAGAEDRQQPSGAPPAAAAAPEPAGDAEAPSAPPTAGAGAEPAPAAPSGGGGGAVKAEPEQVAGVKQEVGAVKTEPEAGAVEGAAAVDQKQEAVKAEAKVEAAAAGPPTDEALIARLNEMLGQVDFATTTEKQLRRRLEGEYGVDLSDRKKLLRERIEAYLNEQEEGQAGGEGEEEADEGQEEDEEDEDEDEEEPAPSGRKRKAGSSLGSFLSPEMQEFLGERRMPRTQVVKRMWEYIKEHNLQDPKDKRVIIFDDKLKVLFPGVKANMFKMQKLLSKHCKTDDVVGGGDNSGEEEEEEEEERRPAPKKARAASGSRRRSGSAAGSGGGDKERKPNGFTKECNLSAEMAAWIGKPTASRPEITKFFWAYCKERGLQDPSDKSYILADAALLGLTGEARFKGFGLSKLIKDHITGYA